MHCLRDDRGMGIAEALIGILLFGIIAVAAVPAIIVSIKISGQTTTVASGSSVANERIELARQADTTCASFVAFLRTAIPTSYSDARGATFTVTQVPSPATAAGYNVTVSGPGDSNGDGVLDSFCLDTKRNAINFSVDVDGSNIDNPNAAHIDTIIMVPGF